MSSPELPEKLEELMAGYVLGNLSSEEAEQLQRLLAEHPEQAKELNSLQEVLELMPYALPEVTLPQHLRQSILEEANVEIKQESPRKQFSLPWRQMAGSIAAVLVVALGWDNYNLRQNLTAVQTEVARQKDVIAMLRNPDTHLVSLKGMDMASAATGRIVMTPGEPKSVLILQNLPVLPEGKFYQLWSVVRGEKIPSGQFNASEKGTVLVKLPTPSALEVTGLVVTVEVSPVPQSPSGPMVMTSNL
ncbi:anti-sigma factor [Argonema antarcticum]|uniref:anti-sigma factor n=1 Tax=Argonema antarcticum TaxID=2942763 RepID=UPI002012859B|nr:anti-sigma factor [Argonema antarcticum]MCL1469908.1 anti-sigma factor [Argonema antarcticum A004/B2]